MSKLPLLGAIASLALMTLAGCDESKSSSRGRFRDELARTPDASQGSVPLVGGSRAPNDPSPLPRVFLQLDSLPA